MKEFWIAYSKKALEGKQVWICEKEFGPLTEDEKLIHVIEKSAYLQQLDDLNLMEHKLDKAEAKYDKAVEALEFYADPNNWSGFEERNGYLYQDQISPDWNISKEPMPDSDLDQPEKCATIYCGGKRARQTLKELGEIE